MPCIQTRRTRACTRARLHTRARRLPRGIPRRAGAGRGGRLHDATIRGTYSQLIATLCILDKGQRLCATQTQWDVAVPGGRLLRDEVRHFGATWQETANTRLQRSFSETSNRLRSAGYNLSEPALLYLSFLQPSELAVARIGFREQVLNMDKERSARPF